jgi:hypothetical protein
MKADSRYQHYPDIHKFDSIVWSNADGRVI